MTTSEGGRTPILADKERHKYVLKVLAESLQHGMTMKRAAERAGVSDRSAARFCKMGRVIDEQLAQKGLVEPDKTFTEYEIRAWQFWRVARKARMDAMEKALTTIQEASKKHWQAAAWWLERTFPREYSRRYVTVEGGSEKKPIRVMTESDERQAIREKLAKLTPQQLAQLQEIRRTMESTE